jgi:acyl-CoA synthetase (AMP-forming)/AMP-acid ligase II
MANVVNHLRNDDHIALVGPDGQQLTYAGLQEEVGRVAGGLVTNGIEPGDRIVLLLPMGIDLYVALLAVFHVGATATLIDPAADIQGNLERHPPDAFIGIAKAHLLRLKVPALRGLKLYVSSGFIPLPHKRLQTLSGATPPVDAGTAPALLTFTTGTTGKPKAIARTHDFLLGQHQVLHHHMPFKPGDVDLPTLPVFLLHSLAGGATCVIADADLKHVGSVAAQPIIQQIHTHHVTSISASPALFRCLVDHLVEQDEQITGLQHLYTGGARVPADLVDSLSKVAPNASIHVVYGSTEAEPIAVLDARAHRDELLATSARGALVGRPVPDIQIRIDGDPVGEIQVAGSHVNRGYLDNPEADAAHKIHEGETIWHRTGDVGQLDDNGDLWLVGRVGESVAGLWPLCAEGAAESLDFVRKAGLVDIDGKAIIAVELKAHPDDWQQKVEAATSATPVKVDRIPVDPRHNAKVDRTTLVQQLKN